MMIFDFDGVLMDSLDEVVVTGYNAVTEGFRTTLDAIPETVAGRFRQNRFHIKNSEELYALMAWCVGADERASDRTAADNERLERSEFEAILKKAPLTPSERSSRLFAAREAFIKNDREAWLLLHKPFRPIWNELADGIEDPLVLLTTKNRAAVVALCSRFNLEIAAENIYSGDDGTDKTTNMKAIHRRFNRPAYRFIDDAIANLKQLDADCNAVRRQIELVLAEWGYVGPEDAAEAERLGFGVLPKPTLVSFMDER